MGGRLFSLDTCGSRASKGLYSSIEVAHLYGSAARCCQDFSGKRIAIDAIAETRDADIPFYVGDRTEVRKAADWKPQRALSIVLEDVWRWLVDHRGQLEPILR